MILSCTRRIEFCSGHRVYKHEGKCAKLHGHGYVAYITARKTEHRVDTIGRVIDFSILKSRVGGWIEQNWDHGFILNSSDGDAIKAIASVAEHKLFLLPEINPTAENLALYL